MAFEPGFDPSRPRQDGDLWFVLHEEKLVVKQKGGACLVPRFSDLKPLHGALAGAQYFGHRDGTPCFLAELHDSAGSLPDDFACSGLFELLGRVEDELLLVAGCAAQLIRWANSHRFCGRCGTPTEDKAEERAKTCPACGLSCYPRLSPAVIVAVIRDDKLLLATSPRFRVSFWSVLAGFVEPGETLEQCVVREVEEEVGIRVKNVRYFGSQPWPFPDSLMLGFTAEYAEGEIQVDGTEIVDAEWFAADSLPSVPPSLSIARKLIDWFAENHPEAST